MAVKDLHSEPFDDSTIAKLEIFEDYAQAWIPTFVMQGLPVIYIFDFFAGTGYDLNGIPGSPIRLLSKIEDHVGNIFQKKIKIKLVLNEFDKDKFVLLKNSTNEFLRDHSSVGRAVDIEFYNESFEILFPKLISDIRRYPSLVYLDQNGIKFLSDKYFLELEKTSQTDFLYFVSASYFLRFGDTKEFKMHLDIDLTAAKAQEYKFIHRAIVDQLKLRLPQGTKVKLYPFSLKKGRNIHGIIFGASHARAVEKFLSIAWKRNEVNGEANFDIDDDASKEQLDLFDGKKLGKIEKFQMDFVAKVLAGEITNNFQALDYVLDEGHIANHAAICLRSLKKRGEIDYTGSSPLVAYDNIKKGKKLDYKIKKP